MTKLRFENLTKMYGKKAALDNFSCELKDGVYGLLGPNGAGKTTLINIIVKLISQTSGKVFLDDRDINSISNKYFDNIGFMPQYPRFYPNYTARQLLDYLCALKGITGKKAAERINQMLSFVNLSEEGGKKVGAFSGGMRQRLAIAAAMLNDPKILILDEPTAGLDPAGRESVMKIIHDYRQAVGATVIIISHSMEDMALLADKLLVMNKGSLEMFDTVENVFFNGDRLREIGLNVPIVTRVFYELKAAGIPVPDNVFTVSRAVEVLKGIKAGERGA